MIMGDPAGINPAANAAAGLPSTVANCSARGGPVGNCQPLTKSLPQAKMDHDKTLLQRQIKTTDKQIDKLVYELYGLSDDEIGIVEGATE